MLFLPENLTASSSQPANIFPPNESIDIAVDSNGEILVGEFGDLTLTKTNESIALNLLRRISTPVGGYERVVASENELEFIDTGYSNPLVNSVSAPLTAEFSSWGLASLIAAASKDPRIVILDAKIIPDPNRVRLYLSYTLNGSQANFTFNL